MQGLLKKLVHRNIAPETPARAAAEMDEHEANKAYTLHSVRVFFVGGPYVVLSRRSSRVGDLLGIAADACRATRGRNAGDIIAVTVDVDPTETIQAMRHQLADNAKKGRTDRFAPGAAEPARDVSEAVAGAMAAVERIAA